ncbi:MAG TPA: small multi-drug export protein [Methanocorpusculum sp.]|nr:small multi-drug export protein [Methanocorpusculum sp.]
MSEEKKSLSAKTIGILRQIAYLIGPLAVFGLLLLVLLILFPPLAGESAPGMQWTVLILLMVAYIVPPFGKETIVPAMMFGENIQHLLADVFHMSIDTSSISGYPVWVIILCIVGIDILVSAFITLNFSLLLKIPVVGPWLRWIMRSAQKIMEKRPWIESLSSAGLLIFMYIPLQGSGAMTTSVIARLLGYKPVHAIGLVALGSLLSTLTVIFGFSVIIEAWNVHPLLGILIALILIAVIVVIAYFWSRFTRKFLKPENL